MKRGGTPLYHFRFRGMVLPQWVVTVQWRRFNRLGVWMRPDYRKRIEMYLEHKHLTVAGEVLGVHPVYIRRAVCHMLERMHKRDHYADWV
jgi:hypothetical protein